MATAQIVGKFSYWIRGNLYISVTNKLNSLSFHQLRGKSFQELPYLPLQYEPSDVEMAECINQAYEDGKIHVDSMKSEVITFAGYGDPLFKIDEICSAVKIVKENRHGVPFRVKTNGLFHDPEQVLNEFYFIISLDCKSII